MPNIWLLMIPRFVSILVRIVGHCMTHSQAAGGWAPIGQFVDYYYLAICLSGYPAFGVLKCSKVRAFLGSYIVAKHRATCNHLKNKMFQALNYLFRDLNKLGTFFVRHHICPTVGEPTAYQEQPKCYLRFDLLCHNCHNYQTCHLSQLSNMSAVTSFTTVTIVTHCTFAVAPSPVGSCPALIVQAPSPGKKTVKTNKMYRLLTYYSKRKIKSKECMG